MKLFAIAASAAVIASASPVTAQEVAVDGGIGTTGVNANLQWKVMGPVVLRGGYNYLEFTVDGEEYDGIVYDGDVEISTVSASVDLHPFQNGFLLAGGVFLGDKSVALDARPDEPVEIGGEVFQPEEVGILTGQTELADAAPYAGIGWDSALYKDGRWSFNIRAGVMFSGEPTVELTARDGLVSDDPRFLALLEQEELDVEEELEDYQFYPVVNLGVGFRF